jgi:hypothetical protein
VTFPSASQGEGHGDGAAAEAGGERAELAKAEPTSPDALSGQSGTVPGSTGPEAAETAPDAGAGPAPAGTAPGAEIAAAALTVPAAAVPPIWAVGVPVQPSAGAVESQPQWQVVFDDPPPPMTPRQRVFEVLTALAVAAVIAGLGLPLAYLWDWTSPHVVLEMTPNGPAYTEANPEGYVGGESVYYMITLGVGLISAVVVWLLVPKHRGPILLAGLAVGSVLGAVVMAKVGQNIGLDEYERLLKEAPVGARFEVPVKVRAGIIDGPLVRGALLLQAIIATAAYTLMAGFYATASLRPERERARIVMLPDAPDAPDATDAPGHVTAGPEQGEPDGPDQPVSSGSPASTGHRAAPAPPAAG